MKQAGSLNRKIRKFVQLFFFTLVALIATNHILAEKGLGFSFISDASLHALCPLGGVVSIYKLMATGTFVQKIHQSAFVLMGILAFMSIAFGAVFCGWICPLGTFQEWLGKLGKMLFKGKYHIGISGKTDKYLRYIRYVVLAWVIYVTAISGKLVFADIDPYHALFTFWSGEVAVEALVFLGILALASLVIERPWCKYACPLGALMGPFNAFRLFKIRRNENTCAACGKCDSACPMGIRISEHRIIRDHQCIGCMECTSEISCPIKDTVGFSLEGGKGNASQA